MIKMLNNINRLKYVKKNQNWQIVFLKILIIIEINNRLVLYNKQLVIILLKFMVVYQINIKNIYNKDNNFNIIIINKIYLILNLAVKMIIVLLVIVILIKIN